MARDNFEAKGIPRHAGQHSDMNFARTTEPVELLFGLWTRVGPKKHVLDGAQSPRA